MNLEPESVETWLYPNRRAIALGFLVPALFLLTGCATFLLVPASLNTLRWAVTLPIVAVAVIFAASLVYHIRLPRLAFGTDELWVYLNGGTPYRIPLEAVECFFLGQTEFAESPRQGVETRNIVIRLAERAESWHRRPVRPNLGNWCDGYITIKGGWCEPIDEELLRSLNRRLAEKHRASKASEGSG